MNSKNAPKDVAADTKIVVTDGPSIAATADDLYTVVARMQVRLEALEVRVEQLEGHIHMYGSLTDVAPNSESTPPYVEGINNEGQEVWKPI